MSEAAAEAYAAELCRIFGRNFRRIRQDADCNLSAMAERHGIDRKLMTAIEREKRFPSDPFAVWLWLWSARFRRC